MNRRLLALALIGLASAPLAASGPPPLPADEEVLAVRFAALVGGREAGSGPLASPIATPQELIRYITAWDPSTDNKKIRELLALNDLHEVIRQAAQLPRSGGRISGLFHHRDSTFELELDLRPDDRGWARTALKLSKNGVVLSAPVIQHAFAERAIVSSTNGPEAPFVFIVVEAERMTRRALEQQGGTGGWRPGPRIVDGETILPPKAVEAPQPAYPEDARKAKLEGKVILEVIIDPRGAVKDVRVVEGLPHGLTEAALEAVRKWRFQPAVDRTTGQATTVSMVLTIQFRLS